MASDSDCDEDFVSYGTPLEPLEEDEPLRKPVPLHEQTVKDEKGRYQRFHGAFTGGFSAGYFNTVGSKEGWTPSTFVSSRQQKANKDNARPEDFMDEEDFSEHGIAPRNITTSLQFSSRRRDEAAEKARAVSSQLALIPGDTLLEELITPARTSIGVELLRRMGWREGQGVGPRVKRKAGRRRTDGSLPPAASDDSDEDDEDFAPDNVTFAPKDMAPVDFSPRLGLQGLGYRGLDPSLALPGSGAGGHLDLFCPQSETRSQLFGDKGSSRRRGGVAGQAFGVGALEDDDDEDMYQRDSMSKYDTVLGGEEPGDGLYGWTAPQQYSRKADRSRDASYLGKILEGFTLAQNQPEERTIFPPPSLPRDYRPVRRFRPHVSSLSGVSPALAEALKTSRGHMVKEEPQQGGRHQLDSSQRRTLLGEDALQGPSSVLDLLKPEDRQRLLSLRMSSTQKTSTSDPQESSSPPTSALQQEALAVWRGVQTCSQTFRPFQKNPDKQARYEGYLSRLRQGDRDALDRSLDRNMTEWERSREREEFVRASILYRPASSSLSSRFTRGKHQEDEDTVEVPQDQEGDVEEKQAAVTMKMFGQLTRETLEWHPDKLLCKRFNVPDPFPGSSVVGLLKVKRDKFSVFNFLTVLEDRETAAAPKTPESAKKSRWDVSEEKKKDDLLVTVQNRTEMKQDETSAPGGPGGPETPGTPGGPGPVQMESVDQQTAGDEEGEEEEDRPPMDLFKAIFAGSSDEDKSSSSSESNDEEDEDGKEEGVKMESQPATLFRISSSSIVSSSQPAGASAHTTPPEEEEFGPKLPPPSAAVGENPTAPDRGGATSICSPKEDEKPSRRSKDKKQKKKNKHKKDKKKKKRKKHKHKAKQQKKNKKDSDSSSEDSDEDNNEDGPISTDELLRRLKTIRSNQIL